MPSKLYVGNLAYSVSNSDLEELFSQAGQVQSVAVITDKFSGQSKGFGFVEMANAEDASKAIQTLNDTDLKGRNIKVSEAKPRESSFGGGGGGGGNRRGVLNEPGVRPRRFNAGPSLRKMEGSAGLGKPRFSRNAPRWTRWISRAQDARKLCPQFIREHSNTSVKHSSEGGSSTYTDRSGEGSGVVGGCGGSVGRVPFGPG